MEMKLIVYSKKDCQGCMLTKNFLSTKGYEFEDLSITDNETNLIEVEKMGFRTVPVVVFPDKSAWAFRGQHSLTELQNLINKKQK